MHHSLGYGEMIGRPSVLDCPSGLLFLIAPIIMERGMVGEGMYMGIFVLQLILVGMRMGYYPV